VLPTAALDAGFQRRLAAQLEAAGATTFQKSRRVAATIFRWMLPTRPSMATDGKVGPPGRSPRGLFRLVHNWN